MRIQRGLVTILALVGFSALVIYLLKKRSESKAAEVAVLPPGSDLIQPVLPVVTQPTHQIIKRQPQITVGRVIQSPPSSGM